MNNDSLIASKPGEANDHEVAADPGKQLEAPNAAANPHAWSPPSAVEHINGIDTIRSNGNADNDKSDSEAETVVLSGKEDDQGHKSKKAIKLEETGGANNDAATRSKNDVIDQASNREHPTDGDFQKPSLKRKRTSVDHGSGDDSQNGNSSNLSSTVSSPVQEARSSKATDTASNRSRSSPPLDDIAQAQDERRASKSRLESSNGPFHHRNVKSERGSEPATGRKRRDTRSATHYDEPTHRSESPPSSNNNRANSIHSTLPPSSVIKRRKAPAPLHVERRRKASEDTHPDSDDDISIRGHQPLNKLSSTDNSAMSPAKMVSHKKNRDRNGRTLLARACAQGVKEAEQWLKDRPQDLDVPDNAGNTPLQIAALEGDIKVVQLLLDAGCDTTCKNIDKDTPLIDAIENGHLEVVRLLLKAGLDPRQTNAKGAEPIDLVPADDEDADEMRAALMASKKEKLISRRPSEDNRQHSTGSRDIEMTAGSTSGASPVNSTRSPPPPGPGARRRTARSQPTDDALLWVNATPARLRDAAGKGDLTIVDHILKMRPQADTESLIAAARGGHDVVLGLMLAIAAPDPDPEPLRSGEYKPAYSTPMLAAIGRGNINIINLLVTQPGFDPTRRMFRGMTYHEIAKDRQGSEWQEEYDILKEAYNNYKHHGPRKSNNNSPRRVRSRRANSSKSASEPSSSPHDARKPRQPSTLKEEPSDGTKGDTTHKSAKPKFTENMKKQSSPAFGSDRDSEPLGPPKPKGREGTTSNDKYLLGNKRADSLKPKRRLMSGNDFKSDQDVRRRASLAAEADPPRRKSGDSIPSHEERHRRLSDTSESRSKARSETLANIKEDQGKKRHRLSVSPQARKIDLGAGPDAVVKKKRQRVNSQGSAVDQDRDRSFHPAAPVMVANMIPSPSIVTSPTVPQGTAPVAFMGSNVSSPVIRSPNAFQPPSAMISPVNSIDQALNRRPDQEDLQTQKNDDGEKAQQEQTQHECERERERERERQATEDGERAQRLEDEKRRQAAEEEERIARAERDEAERKMRIARVEEQARLEAQEAQRQLQLEREREDARLAKQKREDELQQRRLEQERLRKEEQERKRREMEERENLRRVRQQEQEERQRLDALPNGLRRAAGLAPEIAKSPKEIKKWLPLRTVTTQEIIAGCDTHLVNERWIANIQAAPILAIKDLDLSQCKSSHHVDMLPI